MAKKEKTTGKAKAVALMDLPAYGATIGMIINASAELLLPLVVNGYADDNDAAIAYAVSQNATEITL